MTSNVRVISSPRRLVPAMIFLVRQHTAAILVFVSVCLLVNPPIADLKAQAVGATVRGRVQDPSGAVLPQARITAQETEKGILYRAASDSLGMYQMVLPVGTYDLQVEAGNFATIRRPALTLSLGETTTLNFTLQV